jgi:NhaA family Na+:H+ antiporter
MAYAEACQMTKTVLKGLSAEVAGGLILLMAALGALAFVNLGGAHVYHDVLEYPVRLGVSGFGLEKTVHHWINDGLMVLFFLLVGIEIQREMRTGSLRDPKRAVVPVVAAAGGFMVPALVYMGLTHGHEDLAHGWSVPAATDIAFAIALVTVLKKYVPDSLRAFLLALAVADDLMAIMVIAVFYTAGLEWMSLLLAGTAVVGLWVKNRMGLRALWVYIVAGLFMWICVLQSGVHATVAGVVLGLLLPLDGGTKKKPAPADVIEHALQPWVRWLVLPVFAFANVGVDMTGLGVDSLVTPLTLGVAVGLLAGKQLGVFGAVWGLEKILKLPRPEGASWRQVYGVACVCGIGFTMSLFVGMLALAPEHQSEVRIGVLAGSLVSALMAVVVLRRRAPIA